jgi:hypothetical protein
MKQLPGIALTLLIGQPLNSNQHTPKIDLLAGSGETISALQGRPDPRAAKGLGRVKTRKQGP